MCLLMFGRFAVNEPEECVICDKIMISGLIIAVFIFIALGFAFGFPLLEFEQYAIEDSCLIQNISIVTIREGKGYCDVYQYYGISEECSNTNNTIFFTALDECDNGNTGKQRFFNNRIQKEQCYVNSQCKEWTLFLPQDKIRKGWNWIIIGIVMSVYLVCIAFAFYCEKWSHWVYFAFLYPFKLCLNAMGFNLSICEVKQKERTPLPYDNILCSHKDCDSIMQLTNSYKTYGKNTWCSCDECGKKVWTKETMFHCKNMDLHKNGYDKCFSCGIKGWNMVKEEMKCINTETNDENPPSYDEVASNK
eukprot:196902_1